MMPSTYRFSSSKTFSKKSFEFEEVSTVFVRAWAGEDGGGGASQSGGVCNSTGINSV